jgi:cell wall-associated NlpC family hydrolase
MYGIVNTSVIPMRASPSERSEMTSQLLWGEMFEVVDEFARWVYVCSNVDKYCGWINQRSAHIFGSADEYQYMRQLPFVLSERIGYARNAERGEDILIPLGSVLYDFNELQKSFVMYPDRWYRWFSQHKGCKKDIVGIAKMFVGAPYLWGGRTMLGIDCSGFTQLVYRLYGIDIPRDAKQQATVGSAVEGANSMQPGNLAFFCSDDDADKRLTHVGLIIDNQQVIHASGIVRIDALTGDGIYNKEEKQYTHRLLDVRNVFANEKTFYFAISKKITTFAPQCEPSH